MRPPYQNPFQSRFHNHLLGANGLLQILVAIVALVSGVTTQGASYMVTTTNDTGPNSLRALLTAANSVPGPHTITFDNTGHFLGGGTITLASPLPAISNNISILGWRTAASNNAVTVNGSALVFHPGTINTIQNLNIGNSVTNGYSLAMSGCSITSGGIYSTGSLQLVSTTVIGSPGAGIWSSGNATLNEVTVALSQNGGIYNTGNLVISNSVIVSNSCPTDGGGIYSQSPLQVWRCNIGYNTALSGRGGGIFTAAATSIHETTVNYNVARQDAGGGIYSSSNLTMNGCLLSSNAAHGRPGTAGGGAGAATGGGVYQESGWLFATNCTFSANQVIGGPGIVANAAGSGGGPFPGSGGLTGSPAACGIAGGRGGAGSEGGIFSGGGAGGEGGASYSGGIVSGCSKIASATWTGGCYYDIQVTCPKHNRLLRVRYNVSSCSSTTGQKVYPSSAVAQELSLAEVSSCPYYEYCAGQPGGTQGPGGKGGFGGGGGFPNGAGGFAGGAATSAFSGGGAGFGSGIFLKTGAATLVNSTVVGNRTQGGEPGGHGVAAVFNYSGQIALLNSLVATNTSNTGDGPDVYGAFMSSGNNFIGNNTGGTGFSVLDYQNATPLAIGPLQNNGGPTLTHELLPGSLCILAGTGIGAPPKDQRGVIRPTGRVDIGAYQYSLALQTEVAWTTPAPILYGTALSSTQLSASANQIGTFTFTPPAGTILNAGANQVLTAVFTPSDPAAYLGATNTVLLTVLKANQVITFAPIPAQSVSAAPITLTGSASSGLPLAYSIISGDALLAGNLLSVGATPGLVTVRASQAGNSNYNASTSVEQSFLVTAAPLINNQPTSLVATVGDNASLTVVGTGGGTLAYQWRKNGLELSGATNATLSFSNVQTNHTGSYTVVITNAYGSITSSIATVTVNRLAQIITFATLANKGPGDPPFTVSATASSGLPVSFSIVSGPASLSGNIVTLTGAGTVVVRASQIGNENYNVATPTDQSFTVGKINQTLSFEALGNKTFGDVPFKVSATASSGLPVSFSIVSGPASLSGNIVTLTGAGTVVVRASQIGNENFNAATPVDQSFTVSPPLGLVATHSSVGYVAGGTASMSVRIDYVGTLTSLGYEVVLPSGWSYASDNSTAGVKPTVGDQGTIALAWTSIPASPVEFDLVLNAPAGTTGEKTVSAQVSIRQGGPELRADATPNPLLLNAYLPYHSADTSLNWKLSLTELTRVISLFNYRVNSIRTGEFHAETGTEDGYAAGPGPQAGRRHSADTSGNWSLSLTELTRVISLYNYRANNVRTGDYRTQAGTEDGYAPGPATVGQALGAAGQVGGRSTRLVPAAVENAALSTTSQMYVAGQPLLVALQLTYEGELMAYGWELDLPTGWSYVSDTSTAGVKPDLSQQGTLEWAWTGSFPASPTTFDVVLQVPSNASGNRTLAARAILRDPLRTLTARALTISDSLPVPLAITAQPKDQTVVAGSNITLSISATGQPPLTYQWRRGTTDILSATNSSLVLNAVTLSQGGSYRVVVTDAVGSLTSAPAQIVVSSSLFNPPTPQSTAAIRSQGFGLNLLLETGRAFRVQAAGELINPTWTDVTNFVSTGAAFQFIDAAATNQTRRFYRVVSP